MKMRQWKRIRKVLSITAAAVLAANFTTGNHLGKSEQVLTGNGLTVAEAQETSAEAKETQETQKAQEITGYQVEAQETETETETETEAAEGQKVTGTELQFSIVSASTLAPALAGLGAESVSTTDAEDENESEAGLESESGTNGGSETGGENESESGMTDESEGGTDGENESEGGTIDEDESRTDGGNESESETTDEGGNETGVDSENESETTDVNGNETGGGNENESEYESENENEGENESESEPETEGNTESESGSEESIVWSVEDGAKLDFSGTSLAPTALCGTNTLDVTFTYLAPGMTEEIVVSAEEVVNVGTYTATAVAEAASSTIMFTVTKATVASISWEYQGSGTLEAVYDADMLISPDGITAVFAGADGGVCEMDVTVTLPDGVSLVDGQISHAGVYALTASLTEEQAVNYVLAEGLDVSNMFTVRQQEVADDVVWSEETLFYNQAYQHPTAAVSGVDEALLLYTVTDEEGAVLAESEAVVPGITYTVTVSCADYALSGASKVFVMEKAQVTSFAWEYNGSAVLEETYSENVIDAALLKAKYTGGDGSSILYAFVSITPPSGVSLDGDGNIAAAGVYGLSARINDGEDAFYELADDAVGVEAVFTVNKMQIPVTWSEPAEFTYDQAAHQRTAAMEDAGYVFTYSFEKGVLNAESADGMDWIALDAVPTEPGTYRVTAAAVSVPSDADSKELTNTSAIFTIVTWPVTAFIWYRSGAALSGNETSDVYKNEAFEPLTAEFMLTDEIAVAADVTITGYTDPDGTEADAGSLPARIKDAGTYLLTASIRPENVERYEISADCVFTMATFTVLPLEISLTAKDQSIYYQGTKPTWPEGAAGDYTIEGIPSEDTNVTEEDVRSALRVTLAIDEKDALGCVDAGTYSIIKLTAGQNGTNYQIVATNTGSLTIRPLPVTVTPASGQWKYYSATDPAHYEYEAAVGTDSAQNTAATELSAAEIKSELNIGNDYTILKRVPGESVGSYAYSLAKEDGDYGNFRLTLASAGGSSFEIRKLPVTIAAAEGQSKYYGAADPEVFAFAVTNMSNVSGTLSTDAIIRELATEFGLASVSGTPVFLQRADAGNENAGSYPLSLVFEGTLSRNFELTFVQNEFIIRPLPVTIVPDEDQKKIFGEKEPDAYTFTLKIGTDETALTKKAVKAELGKYVLSREVGEAIGTYAYCIADGLEGAEADFANYELHVAANAPDFEIEPVTIIQVESITSRQSGFKVTTNLEGERQTGVKTKVKIEALEFPSATDGILFSDNIEDYIPGATVGLSFSGTKNTISVNPATYRKKRSDSKRMVSWSGYLPAGTRLRITIVDGDGTVVSAAPANVTVSAVPVSFEWEDTALNAAGVRYVISQNGRPEALTLAVRSEAGAGELAEIAYQPAKGAGSVTYSYETLDLTYEPKVNTAGSEHVMQSITASLVDTLNLKAESKTLDFYVDDQALGIPAASISCENRGTEISISLPEPGLVTSVELEGAVIEVSDDTVGTDKTFAMEFSGENLILSGTAITVAYMDQAGHLGTGSSTVTRSAVNTPITFTIRPELNPAGYLNGKSTTLIISGTACACEPVTVTAAGVSQTTYAAVTGGWSDENESWEVLVSMSDLPENEAFTISADYADVSGQGYSMTANYDEFCPPAALLSPVCEGMTAISGLVEPGMAAALVFDGTRYEMTVDGYGHFWLDEAPMMFAGEDSFDIYVADIAGNEAVTHYEIGETEEITGNLSPLGTFLYTGNAAQAHGYLALPVSASDFLAEKDREEDSETLELPLLLGSAYIVGTFAVSQTQDGIVVTTELGLEDAGIHSEDYQVESPSLLVFTTEPPAQELREIEAAAAAGEDSAAKLDDIFQSYANGYEAGYGEEIPLTETETVWIVNRQQLSILTDEIGNLERYAYDSAEDETYEFYQTYPGKQGV
ncbi:MAG: hypothetical protein LUG99_02765 [Lachnospiraceae bacterium]|nr:hypothetical protein [Lachnospiraceae bacterium]